MERAQPSPPGLSSSRPVPRVTRGCSAAGLSWHTPPSSVPPAPPPPGRPGPPARPPPPPNTCRARNLHLPAGAQGRERGGCLHLPLPVLTPTVRQRENPCPNAPSPGRWRVVGACTRECIGCSVGRGCCPRGASPLERWSRGGLCHTRTSPSRRPPEPRWAGGCRRGSGEHGGVRERRAAPSSCPSPTASVTEPAAVGPPRFPGFQWAPVPTGVGGSGCYGGGG